MTDTAGYRDAAARDWAERVVSAPLEPFYPVWSPHTAAVLREVDRREAFARSWPIPAPVRPPRGWLRGLWPNRGPVEW